MLSNVSQMSTAMMSAPSAASRTAWLRPCPRAAPVMKATLPSRVPTSRLSSWSARLAQACATLRTHITYFVFTAREVARRRGGAQRSRDRGQHLVRGQDGPERVASLVQPAGNVPDGEGVGSQFGVVELVPVDRRRYRGARGGARTVGRDQG